ncbi:hypothetical protein BCR33DRAFT_367149 [Rhizoclosmatium globosum]|uniref:Uncharacterized protein n=1 Tax=Rhizoclosmatium globosum TaxID=329046 RepID=A0A1Y2C0G1_9FUNG|nr:hypothetical protein BCR33DRAFT_367149 [Rhizoclosmatium globosum]|eukprot:ORY40499.1 hypothetical protein BCR33DRAFT_367149 [Rhizoclosmatium globosum]
MEKKSPVKASPRLEPIKASIPALSKPSATAPQQQQPQSTKPNHNEPPRPLTPRALAAWVRTAQFTKSASSQIPPAVHTLTNSPKSFGAAKVDTLLKDVFLEVWRGTLLETQSPTKYDWPSVRLEFEDGEEEEELVCVPTKSTSWTLEHAMPREERAWVWFAWILANALPREEMNRFLGSVLGFIEDTVRSGSPGDVATVCRMTRFYTALVRLGTPSEYSRVHKIVESVVGVFSGMPRGVVEVLEGVEGCWPKAFRMRPRGSMETLTMEADVSMETWCGLVVYIRDGVLGKAEDVRNRCEWAENGIDPDWLHKPPPELIMELLSNLTNLLFFPPSDTVYGSICWRRVELEMAMRKRKDRFGGGKWMGTMRSGSWLVGLWNTLSRIGEMMVM